MINSNYTKQYFLKKIKLIGFSCILGVSLSSCALNKPCDELCIAENKCAEIQAKFGNNPKKFEVAKYFQQSQIVKSYCEPGKGIVLPSKSEKKTNTKG